MPRPCLLVPGFLGTVLRGVAPPPIGERDLWTDYPALAYGALYGLALAPDGASPRVPDGLALTARGPLSPYYAGLSALGPQLAAVGYTAVPWGYDWRLDLLTPAGQLADAIRQLATPSNPAGVIAHSMGGLVTRLAYSLLLGTGQANLLARVVTVGTPHLGSYAWPLLLGQADPTLSWLLLGQAAAARAISASPLPLWPEPYTSDRVHAVVATWPSAYQLLPPLQGDWQVTDPDRAYLYSAANWPAALGVSQAHLDRSRLVIHPLLGGTTTRPPAELLTVVAGEGWGTGKRLAYPQALGSPGAIDKTGIGDGTVTRASAWLDGYPTESYPADHGGLIGDPTLLALVVQLLAGPPPPAAEVPAFIRAPTLAPLAARPVIPTPPRDP